MSTDNKKLDAEANDLLEYLKKTFGSLFEEYKKKKEELKDQPDKFNEFLNSSDWRNKFRIDMKNDGQWCKFFCFVKKTYQEVYGDNWLKYGIDQKKASAAKECLQDVDAFCHLEKFQEQYKKVFDEWLKLDQQNKENKAGKSSINLSDQWQKLKEQISDIGIGTGLTKIIDMDKIEKTKELKNLALENPNFDTMLKFCEQVKKLLDIDLNKYLLRNFDGFVEQFKGIFKEFEKTGYLKLDKWPEKNKKNDKNNGKNKGKKNTNEEKDAKHWKDKINKTKHEVKGIEVKKLTDDEWKDFLWDNRMNFTHEQVRKLGFISDKDGNTDHFTLHRLADFVCFVPRSNSGHDVVHDLRFFSFYMWDSGNWKKEKIEQLFKNNLDINVNKNLYIKDGTPVKYLFGYDVESLMRNIDRLGHDKKFDDDYYCELVNATHDKLVACLCAIDPKELMNAALSENGYVPNSAKDVYKQIDSKEKFNNMFGRYTSSSDECCDYKYLYENLYDQIKKDVIGKIEEIESEKNCKKVIGEFVDSMSEKIFNFSKRNCESYLKQNKSSENINIEYEANRYALWSFYQIIIKITKKAEKEKEEDEKKEFKRVISNFKNKWLAKCNSVLNIKDDEEISNQQLEEFMKFMYGNKNAYMYLNELNRAKSFAERISDDGEFEKDDIPAVGLIQSFLYDVFDKPLAYLKNSETDVLEDWKFDCAYKIINKIPKEWLSNRDNLISLLGYYKDNGNEKLIDNKFDGVFYRLNTGFGFFGFSKKQKESILDKIGEIRDECVFYAFISECIVYEGDYTKEVDIETLQMIIEKTEIYGLGLKYNDKITIDDAIYNRMKRIVELVNKSDLSDKKKKKVFKSISDLYFNKFYYSNKNRFDGKLFGVNLDEKVFKSPENEPTKVDIICEAVEKNKIDTGWFCKFLENSITLACDDDENVSEFNLKESLYAKGEDIVDILLDPVKFEFCKKKYQELKPAGTAFNSFDTIENAVKELSESSCQSYCEKFYEQNKKYFKEGKANALAGEDLNISEDKKGIIESIKTQVVKHGLCCFSSYNREFKCNFNLEPADYFWLFDKETRKNLIQKACAEILTKIGGGNKSEDEISLDDENKNFSRLLFLAERSGNLSVFLENDLAIKLFDKMHDELNDFEFELYQKMIAVDTEDKLLRYLLTSKRISSDKKSEDKRLPICRLLISNNREDIKKLDEQVDNAYNRYNKARDDWENKNDELEKKEKEDKETKNKDNKDKKNNTKKENKSSKNATEINKNIEQMKSEVDEADKKQKELYKAYEAINDEMQEMKKTLTEADKNKLNKIAKDLLAKIKENKGKDKKQYLDCLHSSYYFLANLLNKIEITISIEKKQTNCNFFDLKDLGLKGTKLFRGYMLALCAIEKTETEFDKTTIRDLFIEFIDFLGNELLDSIPQKAKIGDETLKQLKVVLNPLKDFYSSAVGVPYKGLSQSQSNAVIEIFVDLLDRIKNKDIEASSKLTKNMQLKKLIENENCKLDANLVDKIKKLFDDSKEKPKIITETTEIKNNVIDENNKQENQNIKKDIDKKDENDSGAQVINKLKTELKDTENMQSQNPNESNEVNDDNSGEKGLEKKSESENKLQTGLNHNSVQYFEKISRIKKRIDQRQEQEEENTSGSQNEENDDEDSSSGNKDNMNKETEFIENKILQNINKGNGNNNIESDNAKGYTNQNLNASLQDEKNYDNNTTNNGASDNKIDMNRKTELIKNGIPQDINKDKVNQSPTQQFNHIVDNGRDLSEIIPENQTTTDTNIQNSNISLNNVIEMLNKKAAQSNTEISNEPTGKENAESSNTSQKMGYTAPVGSTAVSIASWLIFVFAQAEILLIVSIILTVISAILWGIKFYTEKIKKEEPPTISSPQKNPEETSINNNFLQQYQDMTKNGKLIKQKQEEQNNEIN